MRSSTHRRVSIGIGSAALATAAALQVGAAGASTNPSPSRDVYVATSAAQPFSASLPMTGRMSDYRAGSRVRLIVRSTWTKRSSSTSIRRFTTPGDRCRYVVTISTRARAAEAGNAQDVVAAALPVPSPRYILDEGTRRGQAFRVIRRRTSEGRVRLSAIRSGVLTRRDDIAPSGQVVWSDVLVDAVARAGDECHAGTWRETLGPQIGDVLATARTSLSFLPEPKS